MCIRDRGKFLDATARKEISVGHITVDSVAINGNTLQLFANMNCSCLLYTSKKWQQALRVLKK